MDEENLDFLVMQETWLIPQVHTSLVTSPKEEYNINEVNSIGRTKRGKEWTLIIKNPGSNFTSKSIQSNSRISRALSDKFLIMITICCSSI